MSIESPFFLIIRTRKKNKKKKEGVREFLCPAVQKKEVFNRMRNGSRTGLGRDRKKKKTVKKVDTRIDTDKGRRRTEGGRQRD